MDDIEIEAFIRSFEECTLCRNRWNHGGHLVAALWYLWHEPWDEAVRRIRTGIRRYNQGKGSSRGYHETITLAWISVVARFVDDRKRLGSLSEAAGALIEACGDRDFLLHYYSWDVLMSDEARHRWIAPDRHPLGESPLSRRRVGILIFPDVEVLDFCGPFEVFSTTRLTEPRRHDDPSPYELVLVAESGGVVVATGGLKVLADHTLEDCPPLDLLLVPGGWGTREQAGNTRLLAWIEQRSREVENVASVCTGAMLLAGAGCWMAAAPRRTMRRSTG